MSEMRGLAQIPQRETSPGPVSFPDLSASTEFKSHFWGVLGPKRVGVQPSGNNVESLVLDQQFITLGIDTFGEHVVPIDTFDEHVVPIDSVYNTRMEEELTTIQPLFVGPTDQSFIDKLAWANSLEPDEREEMRRELGAALITAMLTKQWDEYDEAIAAWKATAEVLSDPALTVRLMAEYNPAEAVLLERP